MTNNGGKRARNKIRTSDDTKEKLELFKIREGAKSFDEAIDTLLEREQDDTDNDREPLLGL